MLAVFEVPLKDVIAQGRIIRVYEVVLNVFGNQKKKQSKDIRIAEMAKQYPSVVRCWLLRKRYELKADTKDFITTHRSWDFRTRERSTRQAHLQGPLDFHWWASIYLFLAFVPERESVNSRATNDSRETRKLTNIVMRVLDDRWTTSRSDMITLTTMPTSMSQMIDRKKVKAMRAKSTQARILRNLWLGAQIAIRGEGDLLQIVSDIVRSLGEKIDNH
jgi:hypothetical protein